MTAKNALTLFHAFVAVVCATLGALLANHFERTQLLAAYGILILSISIPAVAITRVSWASGFEHGYRAGVSKGSDITAKT